MASGAHHQLATTVANLLRRRHGGAWALPDIQAAHGRSQSTDQRQLDAATAIAHGLPIVTQDADYDVMSRVQLIKI